MLASGSDGNCMLVEHDGCSVLIDAGLSCREIRRRIELAGASMPQPSAIFLTHEHSDHVKGARVTARRLGVPVICTPGTARGLPASAMCRASGHSRREVPSRPVPSW